MNDARNDSRFADDNTFAPQVVKKGDGQDPFAEAEVEDKDDTSVDNDK